MQNQEPQYTFALVGDTNVGKTSYVERLLTGDFVREHVRNSETLSRLDVLTE